MRDLETRGHRRGSRLVGKQGGREAVLGEALREKRCADARRCQSARLPGMRCRVG